MEDKTQHIFILGSKGLGNYGGYETFVDKLTEYHQNVPGIHYHIACKANGQGYMDETKLDGVEVIDKDHFIYHNADCFKVHVPDKIGAAQAIFYDINALKRSIRYIEEENIEHPIIYILACRIGPFIGKYKRKIAKMGGKLYVNPDGHEWKRGKWSKPIRRYWKESERLMTKHADLMVCDSVNIEKYILNEYGKYNPKTTYIAYGADSTPSTLSDSDPKFVDWMKQSGLMINEYYLIVGRFIPENNYETMIREFMASDSEKSLAIITNTNEKFEKELNSKLHYTDDKRIKFVGTVYDKELLKKIREKAFAYFHGHEVGGTNPSLLEALSSTRLNLLLDVGFNREVGEASALYWSKEDGNLARLINYVDEMKNDEIVEYGKKSKLRIVDAYSWESIGSRYLEIFLRKWR